MPDFNLNQLARRELLCGMTVMLVGLGACAEALRYPFGSIARIGPGFLPVTYAAILFILGMAIAITGRQDPDRIDRPAVFPVLTISAALLSWAWLAPRAGFFVATALLVAIAAFAEGRFRPVETLLLSGLTAAVTAVLFVGIFALPLPLWPWS